VGKAKIQSSAGVGLQEGEKNNPKAYKRPGKAVFTGSDWEFFEISTLLPLECC
jgi:hypothetical protein